MDGLEDLIDSFSESLDHLLHGADSAFGDFSDVTDGINLGDCAPDVIDALSNGDFSSHGSLDFYSSMESALQGFDSGNDIDSNLYIDPHEGQISFEGSLEHHEPFEGEYQEDISFTGNGDKYTDNSYNQAQADKWLAKEQDCLAKGDKTGAAAAHATAMDHLKRIKN